MNFASGAQIDFQNFPDDFQNYPDDPQNYPDDFQSLEAGQRAGATGRGGEVVNLSLWDCRLRRDLYTP